MIVTKMYTIRALLCTQFLMNRKLPLYLSNEDIYNVTN